RGTYPDPQKRIFINKEVCEGCGDCSRTSNCLSVVPIETELGRKRAIDQASCNKDYTCLDGFCPSFVTVHGGTLARPENPLPPPAPPPIPAITADPCNILLTGIGGTGVTTVGALLGMAAHLDGKACTVLDMTGLAQKGGAVLSHIRIARDRHALSAVRLDEGEADLLLGFDLVVAGAAETLSKLKPGSAYALVNRHEQITGAFTRAPDLGFPGAALMRRIAERIGNAKAEFIDATSMVGRLLGDTILTNIFLLGRAYQRGLIPLSSDALEQAIRLNGTSVERNLQAFAWGRVAEEEEKPRPRSGAEKITYRAELLTRYQNRLYAERYLALVRRVEAAENALMPGASALTLAVAETLFKLMAYKDEYEVARLMSDGRFRRDLEQQFSGPTRLEFHLAPPALGTTKRRFGPWMMPVFAVLAKFRFLRGTPFDPFGYSEDRRTERRLIQEYESLIEEILGSLDAGNYPRAITLAGIAGEIRGFGHIKRASIEKAHAAQEAALRDFSTHPHPFPLPQAGEGAERSEAGEGSRKSAGYSAASSSKEGFMPSARR
ncbi:MAG TPA: DUF6537 domain-containing protein, partial [Stellaceae bacterium]|nr:DUF6537 domain-containing protein [Stellaceae bacterium]